MLIQTSSPRPMINVADSPPHIRIQTLRKAGISTGEVALVMGENHIEVEPYEVFPIAGEPGFEALDFYLPFWRVFGTQKTVYNEDAITSNIRAGRFKRVNVDKPRAALPTGRGDDLKPLNDLQLVALGAGGYNVIAKSAFRTEGSEYGSRVFNFTIHCPVTGGGMIRIANVPVDIANATFDPKAKTPEKPKYQNLTLLEAFNRTHRLRTPEIEDRKQKRIEEAEANMARGSHKALPEIIDRTDPQKCPECHFMFGEHEEGCSKPPKALPPRKKFGIIRGD